MILHTAESCSIARLAALGFTDLTFVGVLCFADRIRQTVPAAIADLQRAGITVKVRSPHQSAEPPCGATSRHGSFCLAELASTVVVVVGWFADGDR